MTELLTAAQMRAIEAAAIESGTVTGLELMERAGQGVVDAVMTEWPVLAEGAHRAVVLCGPGNNGGDGFVVARRLKEAGWEVEVFLFGDAEKLPPDAKVNHDRWSTLGPIHPYRPETVLMTAPCVFIDALFGIGQTRPLTGALESTAAHVALMCGMMPDIHSVAIDVPSGVDCDTGAALGDFQFFHDLTVTFHGRKPCHGAEARSLQCGKVVIADIGL